jgi:hypothetical protein
MEAGGFEPPNTNLQTSNNKALTENKNPVLSTSLDILLQKHPDLQAVITVWSELPEHIKQAIKALTQTEKK